MGRRRHRGDHGCGECVVSGVHIDSGNAGASVGWND